MKIKLTILSLVCMISSGSLQADYDAENLQKLFTDKKQRAHIDAVRTGNYSGSAVQTTSQVKVSGYVKRSNGKSVVWLNNKNTLDGTKMGNVKVHQSSIGKDKKVTVSVDGNTNRLKPGETWHKETGKIVDSQ